ncbi:type IV secretory system conjugative DNA transfer family protein [Plantactinospora mayteni]|uniref:Conjugal transfer protein TraG n=1 Tax=Plantactinospora mayteni TaxID=566021 RepID=A0ABQ4F097_9ACTN|nr:type IV secretory system conjugative DNA transfer family protein [Plantactinospora mayteni]GIH00327.1 conjugal transfer protein TraG [Plantactinospora mayteni]
MRSAWPAIPSFDVRPRANVFLGWNHLGGYTRFWSAPEDSVGIVGPPRYGKTSGLIVPSVLGWNGPVVVTSTRGDILQFTGNRRRAIATPHGGNVRVYDPFGSEYPEHSLRWSPLAGCADPAVCYRRVAAMTAVAGKGIEGGGDHWRAGGAGILRAYFHAAALSGRPLADVRRWLARQEVRDPVAILRLSDSTATMWADDLEAVQLLGDRERGSFFSVARNCLEATAEPTVLRSCAATDLDIDHFLTSRSALFLIGPSHYQQAIAPLVVALVDSIAQRAAELAARRPGGRLDPPLLLALDEVANIAPLQSLPSLVSEGGGRGIVTMWAVQSLAQLRARYGVEQQAAILAATTAKLIFGGMSNSQDLSNVSAWAGEQRETNASYQNPSRTQRVQAETGTAGGGLGRLPDPGNGDWGRSAHTSTSVGSLYRPALPVQMIQMLPPGHAWLFYRSDEPRQVETRPAGLIPEFAALKGYAP